jgi:hypothetical protein
MKRLIRLGLCALASLVFIQCGSETIAGLPPEGGGSETATITGIVRKPDGSPAAGIQVRLRTQRFLPDTSLSTAPSRDTVFTSERGSFRLDSIPKGAYNLEFGGGSETGALVPTMITDTGLFDLGPIDLKPNRAITGVIVAPAGFSGRSYVQVIGLERVARADSATGRFNIEGMPVGTYSLRALYSQAAVDARVVEAIELKEESDTTDIGSVQLASFERENYADWPGRKRIHMNTTATGAAMAENVYDFPLLVRLTRANFDFALSDGRDIRFENSKGVRLRYDVERWDETPGQEVAEIWVRVDVIAGNSADQFITMYYGKADVPDWSDGREVFDSKNGYVGVWHLAEEAPDTVTNRVYRDALAIHHLDDRVSSTDRVGAIGNGHYFDGNDYLQAPVADTILKPSTSITVSAWIKPASTGTGGGNLISMGDSYTLRVMSKATGGGARFSAFDGDVSKVESKGPNLFDDAWHHVVGTFDGMNMKIYVDGVLMGDEVVSVRPGIRYTGPHVTPRFIIGKHPLENKVGYEYFGHIDEAVVSDDVRSADWIKMSYENQRADSKLLEFRN